MTTFYALCMASRAVQNFKDRGDGRVERGYWHLECFKQEREKEKEG
jgi:hypothetical protein